MDETQEALNALAPVALTLRAILAEMDGLLATGGSLVVGPAAAILTAADQAQAGLWQATAWIGAERWPDYPPEG